jgi:glutamate-1-semialdehyde 2,1-aminomutase
VNSPVRAWSGLNQTPLVLDYAVKDMIYDVDGHAYIDYCGSWGALIHGHAHPVIIEAVTKRIQCGTSFGITTTIEEQIARKVVSLVDSIEKIRFVSSGTEATMSAVRLARGFTGRDIIVKFSGNYHGHADHFLVQAGSGVLNLSPTSSSAGIPLDTVKHTICLPYNDVSTCQAFFQDPRYRSSIAAVILEPIAGNMGVVAAKWPFIQMLREETKKIEALLIFDEVITGFRVGLKGAQGLYNIDPDLTCLGKIIGGGFPAAAFGGRKEIMDCLAPLGSVYQAGTLSGNPVAMEAGLQSLTLLESEGFYNKLEAKTNLITAPIKDYIARKNIAACIQQVGSMFTLFFGLHEVNHKEDAVKLDERLFIKLFNFLFNRGIYIPPSQHEAWFVSSVHEEQNLIKTRDAIIDFLKTL